MIESKDRIILYNNKGHCYLSKDYSFRKIINAHLKAFPFLLGKSQIDATDSQSGPNISYLDECLSDFSAMHQGSLEYEFCSYPYSRNMIMKPLLKITLCDSGQDSFKNNFKRLACRNASPSVKQV